jgi:competence protein ComFC
VFPAYRITQSFWVLVDWLFPPACAGCNRVGYRWCPECRQKVKPVPQPICQACGLPLSNPGLCRACRDSRPSYAALRSWGVFEGPLRNAIHSLKYHVNIPLGDALAHSLADFVRTLAWKVDLLVPVPLGHQRLKARGYNQAGVLAQPLSILQNWQYSPTAVSRVRETRSQVGLTAAERKENVSDAFQADPIRVSGKMILLMDDVATTGATLDSCSHALLDSGAKAVYALTLARALPHHGFEIV